jgi:hypothetical protein
MCLRDAVRGAIRRVLDNIFDLEELARRTESSMKHKYDLFEKFSDGSSLWRDLVLGSGTTRLRMRQLAQKSENQFYAINLITGKVLALTSGSDPQGFRPTLSPERRSKSQAA